MSKPTSIPKISDLAPSSQELTDYDRAHLITYLRLLDAETDKAPWPDVARIVLELNIEEDLARAKEIYDSHLARARWMTQQGYASLRGLDK